MMINLLDILSGRMPPEGQAQAPAWNGGLDGPAGDTAQTYNVGGPPQEPQTVAPPQATMPEQAPANSSAPQEPGLAQKAGGFLANNPQLANMLMTTFATLASSGNVGQAVGAGAMYHMLQGQANAQKEYDERMQNEKLDREDERFGKTTELKEKEFGLRERADERAERAAGQQFELGNKRLDAETQRLMMEQERLDLARTQADRGYGLDERRVNIAERTAEAQTGLTGAQTENVRATAERTKALTPLEVASTRKKIAAFDIDLEMAKTEKERKALQMKRDALQLKLDSQFEPQERALGIQAKSEAVTGARETRLSEAAQRKQLNDFVAKLPEEDRKNFVLGRKNAKPVTEQFIDFYNKQTVATGEPPEMEAVWQQFKQMQSIGDPTAPSPDQANRTAWEQVRNSVKPGQTYIGPDGKPYVRGK